MILATVLVTLGVLLFIYPALLTIVVATLLVIAGVSLGLRRAPPLRKLKLVEIIFSS